MSLRERSSGAIERCQSWESDDAERLSFGSRDERGAPSSVVSPLPCWMNIPSLWPLCKMIRHSLTRIRQFYLLNRGCDNDLRLGILGTQQWLGA